MGNRYSGSWCLNCLIFLRFINAFKCWTAKSWCVSYLPLVLVIRKIGVLAHLHYFPMYYFSIWSSEWKTGKYCHNGTFVLTLFVQQYNHSNFRTKICGYFRVACIKVISPFVAPGNSLDHLSTAVLSFRIDSTKVVASYYLKNMYYLL